MHIYDSISLSSSQNEKFSDKRCRDSQNTRFVLNKFFSESCPLWDNVE